jgi:uncharacterized protein YgiM (DUF1202 family)
MKLKPWLALATALSTGLLALNTFSEDPPAAADPSSAVTNTPAPLPDKPKKKAAPRKNAPANKAVAPSHAAPSAPIIAPGPAVVIVKNVNVRGQAAINSEIVTRLKQGDLVTVLEEVTLKKPKTDEPAKWAKIALPTNAFVWVSGLFIDPAARTVKVNKLRLRSGPGENYSTLGMIKKDIPIKEIETKGDWIRIEAPPEAYAFVAAHLITNAPAAPMIAAAAPPPPVPTAIETPVTSTPPPIAPAEPVAPPTTPAPSEPPPEAKALELKPLPAVPPPPPGILPPAPEEPPPKRIVTREGYMRNTVSIQAPSYWKLESLDTKKAINYIYSTNIVLHDFFGKRVIVTGEEELDERWPNTPVITVDTIKTVP